MTSEQGKPLAEAAGEVEYAASFLEWFGGEAERVYGQVVPADERRRTGCSSCASRSASTAAITPWNFPAAMMTRKLGPAMAAGCTSVVKPASATPLTAALDPARDRGRGRAARRRQPGHVALVGHGRRARSSPTARVRKISFTGSTEVGKELIRLSADQVKRLSLELGGHAPYIIFDDADLEEAVDGLIASKFRNAGQTCVCANRIYVQSGDLRRGSSSCLAEKVDADGRRARRPARRHDRAADRRARASTRPTSTSQDAVAARRAPRRRRRAARPTASSRGGSFYAPTVLDGVTPEMLISHEETFGPVAGVAPFDTEEEAIALANDSIFGLAAYFHTRDYARLLRVAEKLEYGIVGANSGHRSAPRTCRSAASRSRATAARAATSGSTSTSTSSTSSSPASTRSLALRRPELQQQR